jgi:ribokinase
MDRIGSYDVVVVGGALTDLYAPAPHLPATGETTHSDRFMETQGGSGANQAVAARLGAHVAFVGRIGQDARGDVVLDRLAAEGVDTHCVLRDPTVGTGVALILRDPAGRRQIWVAPGANRALSPADVRAAARVIQQARVLLTQLEVPLEAVQAALRLARDASARTVLDATRPSPLSDDLLQCVDVLRANSREAEALTGLLVTDRDSARQAANVLLGHGAGAAALEVGSTQDGGDLLVWPGGERFLPRWEVACLDETGAGDAFAAALAVMLAGGRSLAEAGPFASAAAALATTVLGAMPALPRRAAVLDLLATREGTPPDR